LALTQFDAMIEWNKDGVEATLRRTAEVLDVKLKDVIRPMYLAITGAAQGVPLFDSIVHLGRDIIRERLRHALELTGMPTAKEAKAWGDMLEVVSKVD
jgi:glutamyl-tRNA synthetase